MTCHSEQSVSEVKNLVFLLSRGRLATAPTLSFESAAHGEEQHSGLDVNEYTDYV